MKLNRSLIISLILAGTALPGALSANPLTAGDLINPGETWPDNRGHHIQAHGGGILKQGGTYYWFGEDRSKENDPTKRYVACYSSQDLVHWDFRNQVVKLTDMEHLGRKWVLERPKVFYNAKTHAYVMYAHIDGPFHGNDYGFASLAVLTSDKVDGDYHYLRSFRPFALQSRDIGQFIDDDGTAYLIFESRPTGGFYIAKLSDDYLDVAKVTCFIHAPLEGGALVHYEGLYYLLGSRMTGQVWPARSPTHSTK